MSFLEVKGLAAGYGARAVLREVSFTAEAGQMVGILGANGSGKTTLLKAVCGILPHKGGCTLDGQRLEGLAPRQLARRCGYIPQRSGITIDLPVLEVVLMGFNPRLGLLEQPTPAMRAAAHAALAAVGLAGREEENYLTLSEGQKQLCILARTLAAGGELLLLDEPESALDFRHRARVLGLLGRWVAGGRRAAVVTLHDAALALNCCDRLVVLSGGRVEAVLDPAADSLAAMEERLAAVYGAVSLHRIADRSGRSQLVMLKEAEDAAEGGPTPCAP